MKVRELMEALEDFDQDAVVRLAQQPHWPFEYSIGEVVEDSGHRHEVVYEDGHPVCDDPDCGASWDTDEAIDEPEGSGVVYIGEGTQLAYLPGSARDALGWGR